jgi:outer membrane protein assembly factor BamD
LLAGCASSPDEAADWSAEKLFEEARTEADAGRYQRAASLYERLEGRATGTLMAQQAQLNRAYTLFLGKEKEQALNALERFIKFNPSSPGLDYAYYLQGLINFNEKVGFFGNLFGQDIAERDQQAAKDSYQSFRTLLERFPQSRYAPDARLRLDFIVTALARSELRTAQYYYRRGAYLAAANRAQQTLKDYPKTAATRDALELLARSYDQLGLATLRDDTRRILALNP